MQKPRRAKRNSTESIIAANQMPAVPLPAGLAFRNDEEEIIWGQFSRARAPGDWREFDLILLHKAVRLEYDIRLNQDMLDRTGPIMKSNRGTPVLNPLASFVDQLQRRQLAVIRSMSLNQTETDPRTLNAAAGANRNPQSSSPIDANDPMSLLAGNLVRQ